MLCEKEYYLLEQKGRFKKIDKTPEDLGWFCWYGIPLIFFFFIGGFSTHQRISLFFPSLPFLPSAVFASSTVIYFNNQTTANTVLVLMPSHQLLISFGRRHRGSQVAQLVGHLCCPPSQTKSVPLIESTVRSEPARVCISLQEKHLLRSAGHEVALACLSARPPQEGGAQAAQQSPLGTECRIMPSRKTQHTPGTQPRCSLGILGGTSFKMQNSGPHAWSLLQACHTLV